MDYSIPADLRVRRKEEKKIDRLLLPESWKKQEYKGDCITNSYR